MTLSRFSLLIFQILVPFHKSSWRPSYTFGFVACARGIEKNVQVPVTNLPTIPRSVTWKKKAFSLRTSFINNTSTCLSQAHCFYRSI